MSINEIAKALLDLREKRMTSFIMSGELREALGFEGYGEALRRRWITPDEQGSGMVTVTNHMTTVNEIRQLAQECTCKGCGDAGCTCKCKDGKCTCKKTESVAESDSAHFFAQAHAFRRHGLNQETHEDLEAAWREFLPRLRAHFLASPSVARATAAARMTPEDLLQNKLPDLKAMFMKMRGNDPAEEPAAPVSAEAPKFAPAPGIEIGVNDSKNEAQLLQSITEYATLGLGRTGDAPETPVVGLGKERSAPVTSVKPPVASVGTAPPASTPYNPTAAMHPGAVTTNVLQADTAAKTKFGRPFSELSADQQAQIENDLRTASPQSQ